MNHIAISNIKQSENRKRKKLLFITNNIEKSVGYELWKGILKKTKENDVDLICLTGGYLEEDSRSLVYNLINPDTIDGYISHTVTRDDTYMPFYEKFKSRPFIALSVPILNFPIVFVDSYKGMRDIMEHLVNIHSYTKIALVRGPLNHSYAIQRYNAYIDVLKENNIYDENLVTPPLGFQAYDGVKGIEILLDKRSLEPKKDIEAIVFVSDVPALGAFNELKSRKISVPNQIAITGCNAVPEALYTSPPLTTITIPLAHQSYIAIDLLLKLINNEEIPNQTMIPAKILVAQSCGCQSVSIKNAAIEVEFSDQSDNSHTCTVSSDSCTDDSTITSKSTIEKEIKTEINEYRQCRGLNEPLLTVFPGILLTAIFDELENNKPGEFLLRLDEFIRRLLINNSDIDFLHDIISIFRRIFDKNLKKASAGTIAKSLWSQARVMIFEASSRAKRNESIAQIKQEETLRSISVQLVTNYNIDILMDILVDCLPKLDIPGCYISLYEKPKSISSLCDAPEKACLIFAYEDGKRREIDKEGITYPSKNLLPEGFDIQLKRKTIVVQSLIFNDIQMGFIQFELGPENGSVYTVLSYLISSALNGAFLLNETIQNSEKLLSAEKMASLGRLTAGIAHEMTTPLSAIQVAMKELENLVEEYSVSIKQPDVLPEDHKEIVKEMEKCVELSEQSAEKSTSFIRGIKGQTASLIGKTAERFAANDVIVDTFNLLGFKFKRSKCRLVSEIDDTIFLSGNPRALSQIITNLINNSIDAADGTEVTITVTFKTMENNCARLTIEDNGPGIPEENLKRIFEPLFTTKPLGESSGLGLGIVKDLVDQFKGTIKVTSNDGTTQFSIDLPVDNNSNQAA